MLGPWPRARPETVGVIRDIEAVAAAPGEARLPPTVAVLVAVALYASLPNQLLVGPRFVIPILECILLIALVATDPRRITRQTRMSRMISLALIAVIVLTNLVALGQLVHDLGQRRRSRGAARCCWRRCRCGRRT